MAGWQIMFHAVERWLRHRREARTSGQLLFITKQGWNTPQWLLTFKISFVWLVFFGENDSSREQAVANVVTLSSPSHPIIDDVGIYSAVIAYLSNFDPPILPEYFKCSLNGRAATFHQGSQCFLAHYNRVLFAHSAREDVH